MFGTLEKFDGKASKVAELLLRFADDIDALAEESRP